MSETYTRTVNSDQRLEEAVADLRRQYREHRYVEVEFSVGERKRTLTQNAALHLWFRFLAETLNDAGLDMRSVIRQDVDIPWTGPAVKEYIWRPVQRAMQQKESTADANRTEYTAVRDVIARHLGEKFGVQVPEWPKRSEASKRDQRIADYAMEEAGS